MGEYLDWPGENVSVVGSFLSSILFSSSSSLNEQERILERLTTTCNRVKTDVQNDEFGYIFVICLFLKNPYMQLQIMLLPGTSNWHAAVETVRSQRLRG